MSGTDWLKPPEAHTIHVMAGNSEPQKNSALNNLNQVWLKMTQSLTAGDVMVCGGDFVQCTSESCFLGPDPDPAHGVLTVTAEEAAKWNVNPNSNKACTTDAEMSQCATGSFMNSAPTPYMENRLSQCICPCSPGKMKYPPGKDDSTLLNACISAMKRGAKIVFLDDSNFIAGIYPDNKKGRDFSNVTLQHASNQITGDNGGGFYWYYYSPPDAGGIMTHAKLCATFHATDTTKPWLTTILGSFNPSYPMSLTFEIATVATGYLQNPVMECFGYSIFDIMTNIVNFTYAIDLKNPDGGYHTGKVWNPTATPGPGGYAQKGCPKNQTSRWNKDHPYSNYCTIPPSSKDDPHGFLQPWYNVGVALGALEMNTFPPVPATWWKGITDTHWKEQGNWAESGAMFGETTFYKTDDVLTTNLDFCGLKFCGDSINKWGETNEQRISFHEKNVVVRVGMTPTLRFPRFNYGLQLINELIASTKKYLKVGLMTSFANNPGGTAAESVPSVMDYGWPLGPGSTLPAQPGYDQNSLKATTPVKNGQMLTLLKKGLPLYVIQKPMIHSHDIPCAYDCNDGQCTAVPAKAHQPFVGPNGWSPTNRCYDIHGNVKTGYCSGDPKYTQNSQEVDDRGNWGINPYKCGLPGSDTKEACECDEHWWWENGEAKTSKRTPGKWHEGSFQADDTMACYDSLSDCKNSCENYSKEAYTKKWCSDSDNAKWISAQSQSWVDGQVEGGTAGLVNWLQGRDKLHICTFDDKTDPGHKMCINTTITSQELEKGVPTPTEKHLPQSRLNPSGELRPISADNPYPIFYRWYKSGLHWKFYMNESHLLFSTQHPSKFFYTDTSTGPTMGYDIRWSNCPQMVSYYDQVFNYVWEFDTIQMDGVDPAYPKDDGICYAKVSSTSHTQQGNCASGMYYSKQKYLPPICSQEDCCSWSDENNVNGPCYPGGKGKSSPSVLPHGSPHSVPHTKPPVSHTKPSDHHTKPPVSHTKPSDHHTKPPTQPSTGSCSIDPADNTTRASCDDAGGRWSPHARSHTRPERSHSKPGSSNKIWIGIGILTVVLAIMFGIVYAMHRSNRSGRMSSGKIR